MDMRVKPVPYLNWSSRLFPDVGPAELMVKHDGDPFAEEADIAAEIDIIAPDGVNGAIVRYHYPDMLGAYTPDQGIHPVTRHPYCGAAASRLW